MTIGYGIRMVYYNKDGFICNMYIYIYHKDALKPMVMTAVKTQILLTMVDYCNLCLYDNTCRGHGRTIMALYWSYYSCNGYMVTVILLM